MTLDSIQPDPGPAADGPAVAHVVLTLGCGGLERVVVDLVAAARPSRRRPAVVCLEGPGELAEEAERLGADVVTVGKRPGLDWSVGGRIRRALGRLGPDVVHTHQVGALFYAGPAARRAGLAVVHTEHGKHYAARRRTRLLGRIAARHADRFCCVSRDIAEEVVACRVAPGRKVHFVPNGIDTARFARAGAGDAVRALGVPGGAPVIGTVGRLSEIKRQDLLVRAVARIGGGRPAPHLVIVGDGPLRGDLRDLAEALGVAGRVHFAGYQADPAGYLAAFDVFALTSRSEGMPLSILEAWAAGKPVVASRVGGVPQLVEDGRTGILFPPGDEARLAEALARLLADPDAARRLGRAGSEEVRARYDLAAMAAAYDRHYRNAIAERGARHT